MENANQRKAVKRKGGSYPDPNIIRPKIKCPNPKRECSSHQDVETFNEDGTVIYKEGKNPFKANGGISCGNKYWECKECKQRFTTEKDNINQITAESQKSIATPCRKSSLIERPVIKCPNLKQDCPSYQDIETFNEDGTVIYKKGKSPFIPRGETSRGNKYWECGECKRHFTTEKCKRHFTTEKDNINKISAKSQNHLKGKYSSVPLVLSQSEGYSGMPQYAAAAQVNQEANQGRYIPLISPEPIIIEPAIAETRGEFQTLIDSSNNHFAAAQDIARFACSLASLEFISCVPPSRLEGATIELNKPKKLSYPSIWSGKLCF